MVEVVNSAPAQCNSGLDGMSDSFVANDDVATLGKSGNSARYGAERGGVQDGVLRFEELRNSVLEENVRINRSIKAAGTARSHAVRAHRFLCDLVELRVSAHAQEITPGEVQNVWLSIYSNVCNI